ncbi:MAG: TetR/AcrR family transcriptional regulator [Acidimicrobiales bacterium]|jgi:AcrR family transcriptional regulator
MQPLRTRIPPRQRATLVNARSRETRRALVRAALELWSEGDFDEAYETSTTADIARAAGVSKGTFYFHFASKQDLLLEMSSATVQAMIDEVDKGVRQGIPLQSLTPQVMSSMARRVARAPKAAALRAAALAFGSQLGHATPARPRLGVAFEALIRYGKDRGELNSKTDVEDAAAMLSAVTMEAINRWGAGNRGASWLRQTLCGRAEIVLRGLRTLGEPSGQSTERRVMKSATARG